MNKDEETAIEVIKEFLKINGLNSTLECIEKEWKLIEVKGKNTKKVDDELKEEKSSRLLKLVQNDRDKFKAQSKLAENYKVLEKKHKTLLQCSRQVFSIVINCLQQFHNIKEGHSTENLGETIDNYKSQIGKYHKIILSDEWDEKTEIMNQAVMIEHKKKLNKAKLDKNKENIIEILLSLRVNALQISPELRKNLVYELIRNDILFIEEKNENNFVLDILAYPEYNVRQTMLALLSIIVSAYKGVEYVVSRGFSIVEKVIEIMKNQEDGNVNQRFSLAILQKLSVNENVIPLYIKINIIDWIVKYLQRSRHTDIPLFCLDFSSALLANIFHSPSAHEYLENNNSICKNLTETLLSMIRESIPTSVLMHLLICLSYISKEKFSLVKEECNFYERITEFVDFYSNIKTTNENAEIDKRTVLDLCAHMFHNKESSLDSEAMEINDMKYEDRIKEFENDQGDLIFECFQDEIN